MALLTALALWRSSPSPHMGANAAIFDALALADAPPTRAAHRADVPPHVQHGTQTAPNIKQHA